MLSEVIKQLITITSCKERKITSPTERDAVLELPLIFQFNFSKLKAESLLHHMRVHILLMVRTFHDQHEKELLNILKYV